MSSTRSYSISRRRRRSRKPPDLRHFLAHKLLSNLRNVFVSLIGDEGTGRRTMLERFLNMNVESLEGSEVKDSETRAILVELENRPYIRRKEIVNMVVFVFNMEQLTFETVFHMVSQLSVCAMVFDVTVDPTLYTAIYCIVKIQKLMKFPPRFILIGHKIDKPGREVHPSRGQIAVRMTGADRYYECSALMNIDMDPVLDALLMLALGERLAVP